MTTSHADRLTKIFFCSSLSHVNLLCPATQCVNQSVPDRSISKPGLGLVQYANDFYTALTNITSGLMLPLTTADLLAHAIVGSVLENLDMDRLIREVGQAVASRILGANESVDDVARELHERLLLRNESTKKVVIESIYSNSDEAQHNVAVFEQAPSLAEARPHLRKVRGSRFTEKYMQARLAGTSFYSPYRPMLPPRSPESKPSSPISPSTSPRNSISPSRKVVSNFGSFSAPANASVFGTAVQSTPFSLAGGKAAFGGMRNGTSGGFGDDDEDDEDDENKSALLGGGRQRVELREGSITLDQVRTLREFSEARDSTDTVITGKKNCDAECLAKHAGLIRDSQHIESVSDHTQSSSHCFLASSQSNPNLSPPSFTVLRCVCVTVPTFICVWFLHVRGYLIQKPTTIIMIGYELCIVLNLLRIMGIVRDEWSQSHSTTYSKSIHPGLSRKTLSIVKFLAASFVSK